MNIRALVAYEGTRYFGWQKTRMGPSIQEALGDVLSQVLGQTVEIQAASRTDRGVHARGQVVNFFVHAPLDLQVLMRRCNALLPCDIRFISMEEAHENFHPTLDSKGKEYRYYICTHTAQLPVYRLFSWHYPCLLSLHDMEEAAKSFISMRDFSPFAAKGDERKDPVCRIDNCAITPLSFHRYCITVTGNRFLYKMVRNLAGTIAYIGSGKTDNADRAAFCAPAHGLHLYKVQY